jgi:hypothetical protein
MLGGQAGTWFIVWHARLEVGPLAAAKLHRALVNGDQIDDLCESSSAFAPFTRLAYVPLFSASVEARASVR